MSAKKCSLEINVVVPSAFMQVVLDPTRVGRSAGQIADEVIAHITGSVGTKVEVPLEIEGEIPTGARENVVRIITENSRTLKFVSQGFEKE